jgi:hypothetical protein
MHRKFVAVLEYVILLSALLIFVAFIGLPQLN